MPYNWLCRKHFIFTWRVLWAGDEINIGTSSQRPACAAFRFVVLVGFLVFSFGGFFFLAFLCSIIFYFVLILCFLDPISLLKEKPKKLVSFFLPAVCGSKGHPTLGIFPQAHWGKGHYASQQAVLLRSLCSCCFLGFLLHITQGWVPSVQSCGILTFTHRPHGCPSFESVAWP